MSGGPYGRGKAPERTCMKFDLWPAADRALWQAALEPGDILDEGGSRARLRPHSNRKVEKGYGRWLTWLSYAGLLDPTTSPASRITRERVRDYIRHLEDLGNGTQTIMSRLQELQSLAEVFDRSADWSFIARAAARVRARHVPVRDKLDRLVTSDQLLDLGLTLMDEADQETTRRRQASAYRDGLIIAFLALEPLRRANLAMLVLGDTLRRQGSTWTLLLEPEDTKTHVPLAALWPPVLVPYLEHYLAVHRPWLTQRQGRWTASVGDYLWVSTDGSPMTQMAIYDRIRDRTTDAFGKPVNPHLFRDAAASTLAIEAPEHVRAAAPVLGHASFSTTEKHYRHAQRRIAHDQFVEVVRKRRDG